MFKTHGVSAAAAYLAVVPALPVTVAQAGAGFVVAVVASAAPDLDHPSSTAAHALGPLRLLTKGVARVSGGHRHGTHSLLAVAVVAVVSSALAAHFGIGLWLPASAVIGYAAHLCGDFLTPGGVPWLWPHPRRYALPLVTTGKRPELLVRFACWVAVYVLAINYAHGWPYVHQAWRMIA